MKEKPKKVEFDEGKVLFFQATSSVLRTVFSFFMPGGLIILVAFLLTRAPIVEAVSWLPRFYPWLVLCAGLFLGWRLNRSQLVFVVLVLAVADRSLLVFAGADVSAGSTGEAVYNAIAFLLPLNLVVFSFMKERGILSLDSLMRLSLIPMQIFGVALICQYPKLGFALYLKHSFFDWAALRKISIAQPALIAFAFATFILFIRYAQDRGIIECGFFWVLISGFFALISDKFGAASTIFFSTGGLVLVIAVIETSYGRAYRDELTGLPARRALSETLYKMGSRFTVAMADIDHFKRFNDRYGHNVGDQVLRMIASKLENASGGGRAFRYGGEEFALVFPGKSVEEALPHLESLRKGVAESGFFLRGSDRRYPKPKNPTKSKKSRDKTTVTISIGVAERDEQNSTPHQVIKAADKALYRAKRKGRNRVCR